MIYVKKVVVDIVLKCVAISSTFKNRLRKGNVNEFVRKDEKNGIQKSDR